MFLTRVQVLEELIKGLQHNLAAAGEVQSEITLLETKTAKNKFRNENQNDVCLYTQEFELRGP